MAKQKLIHVTEKSESSSTIKIKEENITKPRKKIAPIQQVFKVKTKYNRKRIKDECRRRIQEES